MNTIGFFNSIKSWGGGEKWYYDAALWFSLKGYKVVFFTSPKSMLQQKLAASNSVIKIIPFKVGNLSFINVFKVGKLATIFKEEAIDVLVINSSEDLKLAGHSAKIAGVSKIIYRRGSAIPVKNTRLNRYIFSNYITDILANSNATKQTILQNNPSLFNKDKIKVIYNPIDVNAFANQQANIIYKKKINAIVIANVARLAPQKNQQFLIELSAALQAQQIDHTILIAGDGKLEQELKQSAKKLHVEANIIFTGFVQQSKDVIMACDVFILPSLWEGFGYVLAEASLCKKPVIAFNVSSNAELIADNKTGFLIDVNDVNTCVQKILWLRDNEALAESFGEEGRRYIIENFSSEKIMQQLETYFFG